MNEEIQKPKVGVGVMIFKDGKILLGKRKGSHGVGEYALPGGHLEYMESFEECAHRETKEECDIEIKNVQFQYLANITTYAPKHYVHIGLTAEFAGGNLTVCEPDKCEGWDWYDPDNLPEPLFATIALACDTLKTGEKYYDNR